MHDGETDARKEKLVKRKEGECRRKNGQIQFNKKRNSHLNLVAIRLQCLGGEILTLKGLHVLLEWKKIKKKRVRDV